MENKQNGLPDFIQNRLDATEFMENHTLGELKEMAREFDEQKGPDFVVKTDG